MPGSKYGDSILFFREFIHGKLVYCPHIILIALLATAAYARVGIVTIPKRDAVQITIYNSADLTLVRERRLLTLSKGKNRLEFSWAGTLIDPTSIQFDARTHEDDVELIDLSFPPGAPNALVWNISSTYEGEVAVEISYFTSGLSWSADYEGLVDADGGKMRMASFVKVRNRSGEDYDDAQIRLVVGTIHLVENIADLANRGGRPIPVEVQYEARDEMSESSMDWDKSAIAISGSEVGVAGGGAYALDAIAPPEIIREGLSEYFLYTVSGIHAVPDQWSVRWPNFSQDEIEIENFYRQEEGRYNDARRFVRLRNDKAHHLGEEPLPDGEVLVYQIRERGERIFLGRANSKYIPIGETWEIDLGADPEVIVKPALLKRSVENVEFNNRGNPAGWDIREEWRIEILNSRDGSIEIEVDRNLAGDFDFRSDVRHEKYDLDTYRFKRTLKPQEHEEIPYVVTTRKGTRARR